MPSPTCEPMRDLGADRGLSGHHRAGRTQALRLPGLPSLAAGTEHGADAAVGEAPIAARSCLGDSVGLAAVTVSMPTEY